MKLIEIVPLIVLALASYRLTRFFIFDSLIDGMRNKFHGFLINKAQKQGKFQLIWNKLYDLTSCTWCLGFWTSLSLYWMYTWNSPADWNQMDVISVFAIAGIQGMIHALEPSDES